MSPLGAIGWALGGLAAWEGAWWARRLARRQQAYRQALQLARSTGRPLVIIGAPDLGTTAGYGCGDPSKGDVVLDMRASKCPNAKQVDITRGIPFADDSAVVFCSCTLEYVSDVNAALREINRISGGNKFVVGVEPWTFAAFAYPGAQRTMGAKFR